MHTDKICFIVHYLRICFFRVCARVIIFVNLSKPTGYVMHQQFNIQQLCALLTLYLCFVFIYEQTTTSATYT
jgi:hypothetical protein